MLEAGLFYVFARNRTLWLRLYLYHYRLDIHALKGPMGRAGLRGTLQASSMVRNEPFGWFSS